MNKLKDIILKDFGWKLLSIAISVGLWFIVINIENPVETRSYTIPISFVNQQEVYDSGYMITNLSSIENSRITIKVRGQRMSVDTLSQNRSKIEATADFGNILSSEPKTGEVPIYVDVKLPAGFSAGCEIISRDLQYVIASVDESVSLTLPIDVDIMGQPLDGAIVYDSVVQPESVLISGAKSVVDNVSRAAVIINVEGINSDMTYSSELKLYDSSGNQITGLYTNPKQADVSVKISHSKIVPITVTTEGSPAEGSYVGEITVSPSFIELTGDASHLQTMSSLELPALVVEGYSHSIEKTIQITDYLPSGIRLKNESDSKVTTRVEIVRAAETTVTLPLSSINIIGVGEGLVSEIYEDEIAFSVYGTDEVISSFDSSQISGSVDVSGFGPGAYNLEVNIVLPEGVGIIGGMPKINVTLESSETEQEQHPTISPDNDVQPPLDEEIPDENTTTADEENVTE